jgi:hypothetical protein
MNPANGRSADYGESEAAAFVAGHSQELITPADLRAALPYPSANRWILDQVSLWFSLGHVPGLTYSDFSTADVLQNGEFLSRGTTNRDWILCHYFNQNMERLAEWLQLNSNGGRDLATAVSFGSQYVENISTGKDAKQWQRKRPVNAAQRKPREHQPQPGKAVPPFLRRSLP